MNGNQIEGLIGMLTTLGILVLMVLPATLGILRERRIDRQIRAAGLREAPREPAKEPGPRGRRHGAARPA